MNDITRRSAIALLGLALPATALAGPSSPAIYTDMHGRALKGYDAVAYHLDRKPVKGKRAHTFEWKGAKWLFATAENLERFKADPERWAPQYGGYCAWAIAQNRPAPINPTIFRIFDGKLYLNLNMPIHKKWLAKHQVFIARANAKWPGVLEFKR